MTKLTDLKEGDCYISPIHGRPVVRAVNPPDALPLSWAWSRLGSTSRQPEEVAVYEKTDLTLIEHYSTHPTPTPLAKKEPEKRWIKDTEVRNGDRFYGYRGIVYHPGVVSTKPFDDGPVVAVAGKRIMHPHGRAIHNQGDLGGKVECLVSRDWGSQKTGLLGDETRVREAGKVPSFSQVSHLDVPAMIPGDRLNGVLLSEIVRRYELGMREERVRIDPLGRKIIRHDKNGKNVLDAAQFLAAQKEFTRLVKAKAEEVKKADKESVKVERDTDYWNE